MRESKAFAYEDIDQKVCSRCGLRVDGQHETPGDWACRGCPCVAALRSRIAELEFRLERTAQKRNGPTQPEQRGGRRERKDQRVVVLDGERVCLTDAARRLGISPSALHFRIVNRTGGTEYGLVDLRSIGADVVRSKEMEAQ
ncbi:MAG: hypothetical protein ACLQPN_00695 [Bryobacteraceae bacterium]